MNCPYCDFKFNAFMSNEKELEHTMPIICEICGQIGLIEGGKTRKISVLELKEIKKSPAWEFLKHAQQVIYHLRDVENKKPV